ncbi:MAG TPA: hypothetical protein VFH72_13045 [Candidatus Baltobacteraceae bacterium]|nr:hypothetical protein [Candidatus Baltobacteraceae bacterium]
MISALVLAAASASAPKPVRSLSYTFTAASSATYSGTITADVMGGTQDGALIVRFAQKSDGAADKNFAPASCWVYGDTRVSCDDPKALSPVEMELAHLLGRNFIDGNNLDEKNHWRIAGPVGTAMLTDDFTVTANDNGVLAITESRKVTGSAPSAHDAQISYDMNRTVPLSVHYTQSGQTQATVDLKLTADSLAAASKTKP